MPVSYGYQLMLCDAQYFDELDGNYWLDVTFAVINNEI